MLIAMRALLGIAGATLAPSTLSLIRNMFHDPAQRTVAIGIWVASYSVGAAIGPMVGGLLLEYFWWGSVFLLGVPVMLLLLVLGPVLLPEFRDPEAGPSRPAQHGAVAARGACGHLRPQAHRRGRLVVDRRDRGDGRRAAGIAFVRRQRRLDDPADRPAPVPAARLQRCAGAPTRSVASCSSASISSSASTCSWSWG